jgi:dienelactone hydrolase
MAVQTKDVDYTHNNVTMKGFLAFDDAAHGKRPGVLVCHEWWGLNDYIRGRARQLAQLGYVALALDMYGNGATARDHHEAGQLMNALMTNPDAMGRVQAAVDVLRNHANCDGGKLASIGFCMGGAMSLQMPFAGVPVRAVAAFHAVLGPATPTAPKPIDAQTKIIVFTGADDPMATHEQVGAFVDAMRKANADYQVVIHGGARHAFTNPDADKKGLPPLKYDAKADRRSWRMLENFLEEAFA